MPSICDPSCRVNTPLPSAISSINSPQKTSPLESKRIPRPRLRSALNSPSYLTQQSSTSSKFWKGQGLERGQGYQLQRMPLPLNWSSTQSPQQANFPDWQQSLPLPSILLKHHQPSYRPPSRYMKTPCPCRIPRHFWPRYSLPCLYFSTTTSNYCDGRRGVRALVDACLFLSSPWLPPSRLLAVLKQESYRLAVDEASLYSSAGRYIMFQSGVVTVTYVGEGKRLRKGRMPSMRLERTQALAVEALNDGMTVGSGGSLQVLGGAKLWLLGGSEYIIC